MSESTVLLPSQVRDDPAYDTAAIQDGLFRRYVRLWPRREKSSAAREEIAAVVQCYLGVGGDLARIDRACAAMGGLVRGDRVEGARGRPKKDGSSGPTHVQRLLKAAQKGYELILDQAGDAMAVPLTGPRVAIPLQGKGALSRRLRLDVFRDSDKMVQDSAISQVIDLLKAMAEEQDREEVFVRSAQVDDALVIDLGTADGKVVVVEGGDWKVWKAPPEGVLFKRTRLTGAMPIPKRGTNMNLCSLRPFINSNRAGWDVIRAWLALAWLETVPVPILGFIGDQGAGKTYAAKCLTRLTDPSPVPVRGAPRDERGWLTAAAGGRVIPLDNVSQIPPWFSNALCRTVTGDGYVERELYTDSELHILKIKRAVVMTSIDPGGLRGDLSERLAPVRLGKLTSKQYEEEKDLETEFLRRWPGILGATLSLVAAALDNRVELAEKSRMADATAVMASVDKQIGSRSLAAFQASQRKLLDLVLEGDPLAATLRTFLLQRRKKWTGPMSELHEELKLQWDSGRGQFPGNARGLSQRIHRLETPLRDGFGITFRETSGRLYDFELSER